MRINTLTAAVLLGASAMTLSACATGFPAKVSRYQAMPAPQGQTFFVLASSPDQQGTLEFNRYAGQVAQAMQAQGYQPAASPEAATMVVRMAYGVDEGVRERGIDPFYTRSWYGGGYGGYAGWRSPYFGAYYGRPYYSRYGYYGVRSPFYYGWDDPFWGSGLDDYTVYKSFLDLDIRRKVDNAQLFEGHAKARSTNDNLGVLVPNLIEAMFTGFPGRSGETVKITVPPAKKS
jgi:hypothetical protein